MITLTETSGDTLIGAVDGLNKTFKVSFAFEAGSVVVLVDGGAPAGSYVESGVFYVVLGTAPALGAVVTVEYQSEVVVGFPAPGGCPSTPDAENLEPSAYPQGENIPEPSAESLEPDSQVANLEPTADAADLRPSLTIAGSE